MIKLNLSRQESNLLNQAFNEFESRLDDKTLGAHENSVHRKNLDVFINLKNRLLEYDKYKELIEYTKYELVKRKYVEEHDLVDHYHDSIIADIMKKYEKLTGDSLDEFCSVRTKQTDVEFTEDLLKRISSYNILNK
jgi:hypothetical protein